MFEYKKKDMEELNMKFVTVFSMFIAFLAGYFSQKISKQFHQRKNPWVKSLSERIEDAWGNLSAEQIQALVRMFGKQKTKYLKETSGKDLIFVSQYGEDIFLAEFFDFKSSGFFIEIGAYDGVFLSNTYVFERLGWKGILVEPLPEKYRECVLNRPNSIVINAAVGNGSTQTTEITHVIGVYPSTNETLSTHSFVNGSPERIERCMNLGAKFESFTVPYRSFDDIAVECGMAMSTSIDLLSIDCEGMDFEVLKSINFDIWRPRLILIESTGYKVVEYLQKFGYCPALRIVGNTVFAQNSMDCEKLTKNRYWQAMPL